MRKRTDKRECDVINPHILTENGNEKVVWALQNYLKIFAFEKKKLRLIFFIKVLCAIRWDFYKPRVLILF